MFSNGPLQRFMWEPEKGHTTASGTCLRFDYEALEPRTAYFIMRDLEALIIDKSFSNQQFAVGNNVYRVEKTDSFEYVDPVDGTVTKRQPDFQPESPHAAVNLEYFNGITSVKMVVRREGVSVDCELFSQMPRGSSSDLVLLAVYELPSESMQKAMKRIPANMTRSRRSPWQQEAAVPEKVLSAPAAVGWSMPSMAKNLAAKL
ncbi:Phosphoglucomutase-like protein 5 [Chelonia mydas]|uniref:Phosphoglucomutase-like protein 5 n=1 Tax=Chelonia mydas TaxID=8469 RepID=M7BQP3_CHEMY|nr:Phosphoglucomutase-like protein 5 [Chelonia mydas]